MVYSVKYSSDGTKLLSGGDIRIILWDLATKESLFILKGHKDLVLSAEFSPDEKLIASGSSDQTIRLWDVAT